MKKYKLYIRLHSTKIDNLLYTQVVNTDDIYHIIGYIYCTSLCKIERIDYREIKD